MSARETILTAVMTALAGTDGVGIHLYRSRTRAVAADAALALLVRPVAETPEQIVITFMDRRLDVELSILARGDIPDSLADATVVSAHGKLMADRTLGGAALDVEEGPTEWDFAAADTDLCEVRMRFTVAYRTADNSLT